MVKFLLELGIDPDKMGALEVEDKLQDIKRNLSDGFHAAQKELDDKEHQIAKEQFDAIQRLEVQIESNMAKRDKLIKEIMKLEEQRRPFDDEIVYLNRKQRELRNEISGMPEVIQIRKNADRMRKRYEDYMHILDKEVRSLTRYYIRKDLSDAVRSIKAIERKKE